MEPEHSENQTLDYSYITDGIYIGTNICCQTHFDEELLQKGISADISLEEMRVDTPFGVLFYVWLPVTDHTPPSPDQFEFGVTALNMLVKMGRKVYVHCLNGHGRAPTLVAAYLMGKGNTLEEALGYIQSKRPSIHLEESQKAALRGMSDLQK